MGNLLKISSGYLDRAIDHYADVIRDCKKALRKASLDFDTIVCTGVSGTLIAPTLAYKLDKHLLVVRKTTTGSHATAMVEGRIGARVLYVDDFVSTGATLKRMQQQVNKVCKAKGHPEPVCVGALMWAGAVLKHATEVQEIIERDRI